MFTKILRLLLSAAIAGITFAIVSGIVKDHVDPNFLDLSTYAFVHILLAPVILNVICHLALECVAPFGGTIGKVCFSICAALAVGFSIFYLILGGATSNGIVIATPLLFMTGVWVTTNYDESGDMYRLAKFRPAFGIGAALIALLGYGIFPSSFGDIFTWIVFGLFAGLSIFGVVYASIKHGFPFTEQDGEYASVKREHEIRYGYGAGRNKSRSPSNGLSASQTKGSCRSRIASILSSACSTIEISHGAIIGKHYFKPFVSIHGEEYQVGDANDQIKFDINRAMIGPNDTQAGYMQDRDYIVREINANVKNRLEYVLRQVGQIVDETDTKDLPQGTIGK